MSPAIETITEQLERIVSLQRITIETGELKCSTIWIAGDWNVPHTVDHPAEARGFEPNDCLETFILALKKRYADEAVFDVSTVKFFERRIRTVRTIEQVGF